MRRVWKAARIGVLTLTGLAIVAVGALIALRIHRQKITAETLAIRTANGVDEGLYVRIGGIDQWIQIRGQDRKNPVLLCVHGGPGGTWIPLTGLFMPWEKEFTVVLWDQRGAGKTLESTGAAVANTMSAARMAQDGIEVSEFLRRHLHRDKLILLAHSWGSILGVRMVLQRPDLFYAYVGTGQVSNMPRSLLSSYAQLLAKARAAGDEKAVRALESIGSPPFDSMTKIGEYFRLLGEYEPPSDQAGPAAGTLTSPAPHYSLWDEVNRIRGFATIPTLRIYQEMLSADMADRGLDFKVPVFFFQGADDQRTPTPLAQEYFDKIHAPQKEMVIFGGGGHFAVWTMPDRFLRELVARVRPLAVQP